jgi:predicted ABC-type transport system involved in lysophospholipase L1 biosynthesis ATPase subunit
MRLHEQLGFALVLATHDPDVAARAGRVVTLEDGRVIADGGPA